MKTSTKKKKQLATVKEWLAKARSGLREELYGWKPEVSLLIAVEQLVKYLEMDLENNND